MSAPDDLRSRLARLRGVVEGLRDTCEAMTPGPWEVVRGSDGWVRTVGPRYGQESGEMHVADARGWGYLTGTGTCGMDTRVADEILEAELERCLLPEEPKP